MKRLIKAVENSILSWIAAIGFALISKVILNQLIDTYSTSIYEVMLADKEPYFSKVVIIPIEIMLLMFLLLSLVIFFSMIKRFKSFASLFLILNILFALHAYFIIEVDIIRGL